MANEADSFDRDRRVWREPTRGKAGTADAHARGGDTLGAVRKIEKVMQNDAWPARNPQNQASFEDQISNDASRMRQKMVHVVHVMHVMHEDGVSRPIANF